MVCQFDFGKGRLSACRMLFASLFFISAGQPLLAQTTKSDLTPQQAQEPMDEDWHNEVSTKALLSELTRLAQELEQQRKDNADLMAKVDRLTERLDGMQMQLSDGGYIVMPKENIPPAGLVDLNGTSSALLPEGDKGALPAQQGSVSEKAELLNQQAEKGAEVQSAPLDPLASTDAASKQIDRRKPEDGGYISSMLKKGNDLITKITDW